MILPTVVNKRNSSFDIYIGRGSYFGNPFQMQNHSILERNRVITLYKSYVKKLLKEEPNKFKTELRSLSGKRLGCFCAPLPCHGDVLINIFRNMFLD